MIGWNFCSPANQITGARDSYQMTADTGPQAQALTGAEAYFLEVLMPNKRAFFEAPSPYFSHHLCMIGRFAGRLVGFLQAWSAVASADARGA
jgi:hypothetical protein